MECCSKTYYLIFCLLLMYLNRSYGRGCNTRYEVDGCNWFSFDYHAFIHACWFPTPGVDVLTRSCWYMYSSIGGHTGRARYSTLLLMSAWDTSGYINRMWISWDWKALGIEIKRLYGMGKPGGSQTASTLNPFASIYSLFVIMFSPSLYIIGGVKSAVYVQL